MTDRRISEMPFGRVYPLYIAKVESKGRAKQQVDQVISWLTGYDAAQLEQIAAGETTLEEFFTSAPALNPNRELVTGVICGVRIEDIEDPLMKEIRYMDKLVDEVARGKAMEKILRSP
ncbi:DUF2200 domain-containing protein [Actinomycetaceae bacterium WB03_NA08]|uniref:DUF2200 domain-containing protein n=1 Tax=Scrofimicrobium canadense TaxID=2652290 RepID=A0A6N7W1L5_9ACTO|nr:DUF2200 domain-containing protein [Scrofimicrobium canadense]MSS83281.1 DUF2200 domain-containing protein [Scrofimicrobium canadense]